MALTGHTPPVCPGEKPPCMVRVQSDVLLPEVPAEKPQCLKKALMSMTEMPQEMSATAKVPQEMLTATDELPTNVLPAVPSTVPPSEMPAEQPSQSVPWGNCLIHNCQEERPTSHLDTVPVQEPGNEGFTHQRGYHGLLVHQLLSWPNCRTSTEDTYRKLHRALLRGRGQRQAMLESMLYQKYRQACTPPTPRAMP